MSRVTTAIRFEPEVHEVLREVAQDQGLSINWIVNHAVKEWLALADTPLVRSR